MPYELDAKIVESMERAAREADDEVAELLAVPVKPGLLERWKSLGGFVPDPLKGSARRSRSSERRVIG